MEQQQQQKPSWTLIIVLLIIFLLGLFGALSGGVGGGTGFDPGSTAYDLALQAQAYRTNHPSKRNYCVVALYIEQSGNIAAGPSEIFYGFGQEQNTNHCEQRGLGWVARTALPNIFQSYSLPKVTAIDVLVFTQVRACDPCVQSFQSWEQQLQQQVATHPGGTNIQVKLYMWEITYGSPSGFAPRSYPAGPYTSGPPKRGTTKPVPVQKQDIDQAYP